MLHYAVNSLEEHNDRLKTTLMYPVGAAPALQVFLYILDFFILFVFFPPGVAVHPAGRNVMYIPRL